MVPFSTGLSLDIFLKKISYILLAILFSGIGCGEPESVETEKDYLEGFLNSKSDAASNSVFMGTIPSRGSRRDYWRKKALGYNLSLGKGAKLKVSLASRAGSSSPSNLVQDTAILLYGPMKNLQRELLMATDNGPDTLAAPDLEFEAPEDGDYFLILAIEEADSTGGFKLTLDCDGNEQQCQIFTVCHDGMLFIKETTSSSVTLEKDTTWESGCEVLLDAKLVVPKGVTLLIEEGVEISALNRDTSINASGGTVRFRGSETNPIKCNNCRVEVEKDGTLSLEHFLATDGPDIWQRGGNLTIRDTVLLGDWGFAAVLVKGGNFEMFSSFISGYKTGIEFRNTTSARIENSYIVKNGTGISMTGENPISTNDIKDGRICEESTWPPMPTDPVILNSEISRNGNGIVVQGQDVLFEIDSSNLTENRNFAVQIFAHQIHPDSFFKNNNIIGNNAKSSLQRQFETYHHVNDLFLKENFISRTAQIEPWFSHCLGEINEVAPATSKLEAGPQEPLSQSVKNSIAKYLNP